MQHETYHHEQGHNDPDLSAKDKAYNEVDTISYQISTSTYINSTTDFKEMMANYLFQQWQIIGENPLIYNIYLARSLCGL